MWLMSLIKVKNKHTLNKNPQKKAFQWLIIPLLYPYYTLKKAVFDEKMMKTITKSGK